MIWTAKKRCSHILNAASTIKGHITRLPSPHPKEFINDRVVSDAVTYRLGVIGEVAGFMKSTHETEVRIAFARTKMIMGTANDYLAACTKWRGLRDIIVHSYWKVSPTVLRNTVFAVAADDEGLEYFLHANNTISPYL